MKIQEVTSNVFITLLRETKNHVSHRCQGTQGAFSDKVTSDVDGFTDEPVV